MIINKLHHIPIFEWLRFLIFSGTGTGREEQIPQRIEYKKGKKFNVKKIRGEAEKKNILYT